MREITIRQAKNLEGEIIKDLVARGTGFESFDGWEIDWNDIEPFWLIAQDEDGKILGCLQFCPSKPISRLEFLGVDPELPKTQRYRIADRLTKMGAAMAYQAGSQGVSGIISHENPEFQQAAERTGWVQALDGYLYYRSIEE